MVSPIASFTIVYSTVYSRRRSKKISRLRVTCLFGGNSPVTGEFPAQMASNAENVSIWWRHHEIWIPYISYNHHGLLLIPYKLRALTRIMTVQCGISNLVDMLWVPLGTWRGIMDNVQTAGQPLNKGIGQGYLLGVIQNSAVSNL